MLKIHICISCVTRRWISATYCVTLSLLFSRIQQIQLLGRDMKGAEHDKLWNQLEAEIHLHRHKTVIRACRGRHSRKKPRTIPPGHDFLSLKRRQGVGDIRKVQLQKNPDEGLGMSITVSLRMTCALTSVL